MLLCLFVVHFSFMIGRRRGGGIYKTNCPHELVVSRCSCTQHTTHLLPTGSTEAHGAANRLTMLMQLLCHSASGNWRSGPLLVYACTATPGDPAYMSFAPVWHGLNSSRPISISIRGRRQPFFTHPRRRAVVRSWGRGEAANGDGRMQTDSSGAGQDQPSKGITGT